MSNKPTSARRKMSVRSKPVLTVRELITRLAGHCPDGFAFFDLNANKEELRYMSNLSEAKLIPILEELVAHLKANQAKETPTPPDARF